MVKRNLYAVLFLTLAIIIFGLGPALADMKDNITYQGNKARIAVGKIKDKADCSWEIAQAVGEMLSTALTNTDKFIVLASQEEVDELIDEIELGQSDYIEEGRGADKGLMEGADILVSGAVTGFEPDAGGSGGGLGGLTKKAFGKIGMKKKDAKILMDIKLIDIRTRRIIKAMALEGKATKWSAKGSGGGWTKDIALAGALGTYSNEPMESAVRDVLTKAVNKIAKEVPKEYYRYQGQGQYTAEYGATTTSSTGPGTAAGAATAATTATATTAAAGTPASGATTVAVSTAQVAENMKLYSKYDFVPGDKVIYYDDLSGEEEGEFPMRWKFFDGMFEVTRAAGRLWILCTDEGKIGPKFPKAPMPEKYTIEFDFYDNGPDKSGNYFYLRWIDAKDKVIGEAGISGKQTTWLRAHGKTLTDKILNEKLGKGVHTFRIMASSRSMKMYIDEHRVANVPKIENFNPYGVYLMLDPYNDPANPVLFGDFRYAEGGKNMRQMLDEDGKIVTHGILFDKGSAKIKAESYKTLKNIGQLLVDDLNLRLSIEGHTDSDGADDYNMDLSQKRAESVRVFLINEFGATGGRLEAKGWGESKPLDTNNSAEGKANNRRVELIKL